MVTKLAGGGVLSGYIIVKYNMDFPRFAVAASHGSNFNHFGVWQIGELYSALAGTGNGYCMAVIASVAALSDAAVLDCMAWL